MFGDVSNGTSQAGHGSPSLSSGLSNEIHISKTNAVLAGSTVSSPLYFLSTIVVPVLHSLSFSKDNVFIFLKVIFDKGRQAVDRALNTFPDNSFNHLRFGKNNRQSALLKNYFAYTLYTHWSTFILIWLTLTIFVSSIRNYKSIQHGAQEPGFSLRISSSSETETKH